MGILLQKIKVLVDQSRVRAGLATIVWGALIFAAFFGPKPTEVDGTTLVYTVENIRPYECGGPLIYDVSAKINADTVITDTVLVIVRLEPDGDGVNVETVHTIERPEENAVRRKGEDLTMRTATIPLPELENGDYEFRFSAEVWGASPAFVFVPFTVDCK